MTESNQLDPDFVARRMYGTRYDYLSPFGKAAVDHAIQKISNIQTIQSKGINNPRLDNLSPLLEAENRRLSKEVENLQDENQQLWQENHELRLEIERQRP